MSFLNQYQPPSVSQIPLNIPTDVYQEMQKEFNNDTEKINSFIGKIQDLKTEIDSMPVEPTPWGADGDQTFCQLIGNSESKFTCEEHSVTTTDGYVLGMFNVKQSSTIKTDAPVVFVQHGLFSDSNTWVMNSDESLAIQLAKAGYNVWFGNNRGNRYSRKNTHLNPSSQGKDFFDYSFFELGKYDAPTQIDYVRGHTFADKIHYIGHSQGTTQMFSALSYNHGNLNDKLLSFTALAPIVDLDSSTNGLMQTMSSGWKLHQWTLNLLGLYEIRDPALDSKMRSFCNTFGSICDGLTKFFQVDSPYGNPTAIALEKKEIASGASSKQVLHYAEDMDEKGFYQYDYGSDSKNKAHYGNKTLPKIPLDDIKFTVPIYLFVGEQDDLADPTDVQWLYGKLDKRVKGYKVLSNFDHYSFSVGKDMSWTKDVVNIVSKNSEMRAPQIKSNLQRPRVESRI